MPLAVIAHRGASGTRPENTLPAFVRAVELGCEMVELDVQLTADGAVVVLHDGSLERTTTGRGRVQATSLEALRAVDAGVWFGEAFRGTRIPTLAEVLAAIPIRINVELKAPGGGDGLEARALAVVEDAGALDRIVFSSFDPGTLQRLRARSPRAEIALLSAWHAGAAAFERAARIDARALHLRTDRVSPAVVETARRAGLAVRAWTVNDPEEGGRLADAGVDAVFTDFPERFLHPGGR